MAKTGDATSPIGWTLAGVLAVLMVVAAFFVRRKR
ncbi:MAG: LPXTG cell wall anchor domain-containing protein [[Clostridium] nexile]